MPGTEDPEAPVTRKGPAEFATAAVEGVTQEELNAAFARGVVRTRQVDNTALDYCGGDVVQAAEMLQIDLVQEIEDLRAERAAQAEAAARFETFA